MTDLAVAAFAVFHLALREVILVIAIGIALSGLDDLFIDLLFFARTLWRRIRIYSRHSRATTESLRSLWPAPMAILVPAWDEAAVIGAMLRDLLARIDYPDYRVFVGLYPNDPAGAAAVAAVADARITAITCARPGPTTKADCLNQLWDAVVAHETARRMVFKAIVLHDAEDVVHAQELWIFDALIPRLAMVQLPVLPLPDPGSRWISGHYADEFAENHAKDMVVREALGAAVPSAGVACGIDRRVIGAIASTGAPFDAACLTEDYELGHRIKALGGRGALVRIRSRDERVVVATREHFPASFDAAVRQKARWLTGIGLSGWDRVGWPRGWADRYMLLRDRKAILAALLTLAAYAAGALMLVDMLAVDALEATIPVALPPLLTPALTALLWGNAALLAWRVVLRAGFTTHAYGAAEGVRAVPRTLASNAINAAAAIAALRRYRVSLRSGMPPAWDKTVHRFPASPNGQHAG
ncbi:MAG: glycosyl transferase family protein [Polymorphobacter sp.]